MHWLIPCRYDPIVEECVAAIRLHHPEDTVVLIDSCSPDTSYVERVQPDHVIWENEHYAWGGFSRWRDFDADHFALVHDSFVLARNISWVTEHPLVAVQWLGFNGEGGCDPLMVEFVKANGGFPDRWRLLFGPMMFASREVCESLGNLWHIQPTDRIEANGMERVAGIQLGQRGWPVDVALSADDYRKHYRDRA